MSFLIPWTVISFALDDAPPLVVENTLTFFLPMYGLFRGLAVLHTADNNEAGYDTVAALGWEDGLGQTYLFLFLSQLFYGTLLLVVGSGAVPRFLVSLKANAQVDDELNLKVKSEGIEEANIQAVTDGILPPPLNAIPLDVSEDDMKIKCEHVFKSFVLKDKTVFNAVQDASLGVEKNSIFGLLGPNGAGKTTLIKCLTSMEGYTMDQGSASIFGHSVLTERKQVLPLMGVCPQHDILIKLLTGRELLSMFAQIRGVPRQRIRPLVNYYLKMLDLVPKADSRCATYSGGNQRRLSVAVSMIGSPSAIFMDEPSTGLDPLTRRRLWEFLLHATRKDQKRERSILLTTHSMEEADALCNRIAIMVNASIRTVGTSQELKTKYGTDRIIVLNVGKDTSVQALDDMMNEIHPDSIRLKESTLNSKKYSVPTNGSSWAKIFQVIMEKTVHLGISQFAVSQRSLEDVFIDFANLNKTVEDIEKERYIQIEDVVSE